MDQDLEFEREIHDVTVNSDVANEIQSHQPPIIPSEPTTFEAIWNATCNAPESISHFLFKIASFLNVLVEYYQELKEQYNDYKSYLNEDNRKLVNEMLRKQRPDTLSIFDYILDPFVLLTVLVFLFFFISYFSNNASIEYLINRFFYRVFSVPLTFLFSIRHSIIRLFYPVFSIPLVFLLVGDALEGLYFNNDGTSLVSHIIPNGSPMFRLCVILHILSLLFYVGKFGQLCSSRGIVYFVVDYFTLCFALYMYYHYCLTRLFDSYGYITIPFLFREGATRLNLLQGTAVFVVIFLAMLTGRIVNRLLRLYLDKDKDDSKANAEAERKEIEDKKEKDKKEKEELEVKQKAAKEKREKNEVEMKEFEKKLKNQSDM